jgi:hypothetical protein
MWGRFVKTKVENRLLLSLISSMSIATHFALSWLFATSGQGSKHAHTTHMSTKHVVSASIPDYQAELGKQVHTWRGFGCLEGLPVSVGRDRAWARLSAPGLDLGRMYRYLVNIGSYNILWMRIRIIFPDRDCDIFGLSVFPSSKTTTCSPEVPAPKQT